MIPNSELAIAPALLVTELRVYEKQMKSLSAFNGAGVYESYNNLEYGSTSIPTRHIMATR